MAGLITYDKYDEMPLQIKEKVCEIHKQPKVKNSMGQFVCIACMVENNFDSLKDYIEFSKEGVNNE